MARGYGGQLTAKKDFALVHSPNMTIRLTTDVLCYGLSFLIADWSISSSLPSFSASFTTDVSHPAPFTTAPVGLCKDWVSWGPRADPGSCGQGSSSCRTKENEPSKFNPGFGLAMPAKFEAESCINNHHSTQTPGPAPQVANNSFLTAGEEMTQRTNVLQCGPIESFSMMDVE